MDLNRIKQLAGVASSGEQQLNETLMNTPGESAARARAGEREWISQFADKPIVPKKPKILNKKTGRKYSYPTEEERDKMFITMGGEAAGLVKIAEAYHDDDDEGLSKAERELITKAEKDLERKGIKVKKFNPDQMVGKTKTDLDKEVEDADETPAAKPAKPAPAAKTPAAKPVVKKEEPKQRGRKMSADSKSGKARAWLATHKTAARKDFIAFASKDLGMSAAHANTVFYMLKKKLIEAFILRHPQHTKFILGENVMTGNYQWIDENGDAEPSLFASEAAAKKVQQHMIEYRNQDSTINKISIDD